MKTGFRLATATLVALVAFVLTSPAAVLLSDSFAYPDGSLVTVAPTTWLHHSPSASGTGQVNVASSQLVLDSSELEDVSAYLAGQPYSSGSTTNVFYAGFTIRFTSLPTAGGDYFAHFKDATASGNFRARIWALTSGAAANKFRLALSSTSGSVINVTNTMDLSTNTDYRIVTRLDNTTSIAKLWINPGAEGDTSVTTTETSATATVAMYAFRQSTGIGSLTVDDLVVGTTFGEVASGVPLPTPPFITTQPESQAATVGDDVTFAVNATGYPSPTYQWKFNGANIADATNSTLLLANVTTNDNGNYQVVASNWVATSNSQIATLTVVPPAPVVPTFSLLTYNVRGYGATNWTTNSLQVQAIARQLQYLQPDVITFNEIPVDYRYEMTNFVHVFLPGYQVAISSGTDGSIVSTIASRHPITRASKWLDGIDLRSFGYSNADNALDNFTRDLFEAQIAVPGFSRPVHVFTTHLKATASGEYADNAAKRAAEATAITNFFATNLFILYPYDPYTLSGDMNASDTTELCIQKLISPATGLTLTNPKNPVTNSINTYPTTSANPSSRLDYIFPSALLFSNIRTSQVFRTDKLTPVPAGLNSNDCKVASDHLPVLMVFDNPYDKPFRLLAITRSNPTVTLRWESIPGQSYRVEASTNLPAWSALADNLVATETNYTFTTNLSPVMQFFRVSRVP
jgi:endonuclease/exonuclease/phosphatase family metal-dependent hydrolase